jgi:hypothetical protein
MLNQSGINKTTGTAPTQILFNVQNQVSVGVKLAKDFAGYVTENGRKIVKAGFPLAGDLTVRNTNFTAAATTSTKIGATAPSSGDPVDVKVNKSNAVGILLHDVDVTDAAANATLLIQGFVNLERIETTTAALITTEVKEALKGNVTFLK